MDLHVADAQFAPATGAMRRARVFGLGAWLAGAALFAAACLVRSPLLFFAFGAWYVVLAVIVYATVVAARRSQVELARETARRFRDLAIRDELTGLYNRRYFTSELEREVGACAAGSSALSLAVIDLDGFKAVNDTLGHAGGDVALQMVGRAIVESCPPGATAARIGGDEFAVLLPGHSRREATRVSAAIRAALRASGLVFGEEQVVEIRATIGVATLQPGRDGGALLREADAALYAGKRALRAA